METRFLKCLPELHHGLIGAADVNPSALLYRPAQAAKEMPAEIEELLIRQVIIEHGACLLLDPLALGLS